MPVTGHKPCCRAGGGVATIQKERSFFYGGIPCLWHFLARPAGCVRLGERHGRRRSAWPMWPTAPAPPSRGRRCSSTAGVRHKAVQGLYGGPVPERQRTLGRRGGGAARAQRLRIVMLREIDSGELGKLFSGAWKRTWTKPLSPKLVPGVLRMSQVLSVHKAFARRRVQHPLGARHRHGAHRQGRGARRAVRKSQSFSTPCWASALGPPPADEQLKHALLGTAAP